MVNISWLAIVVLCHVTGLGQALITLEDVKTLTDVTRDCIREINSSRIGLELGLGVDQSVVSDGDDEDDEDDDEIVISALLGHLDSKLLEMLNVPLDQSTEIFEPSSPCRSVTEDYHAFLGSTTIFLRAVQEKQLVHMWSGESPVFEALSWLKYLWASRAANEQSRSFIEQQLQLYSSTGCFGKNEVLRRDVEVVEYMNDLLDSFQ